MKLMKHITIALVLCAIPAVAVGQTVSCEECTHHASVYMGEGGVIATADDADMVTWVATCSGVTRTGELAAGDDGVVAALWTGDLACMAEGGGSFELGPVMDGGWFWVTDADNSAVGGLVDSGVYEALKDSAADITSAGDGVTMMGGKGAVYLKETASGRVGILPNILPEAPTAAPAKCGFKGAASATSPASPVQSECMLGDGGTILLMTSTNAITGATVRVMDKASVTRPGGTGTVTIVADLWGNGSGHYVATHDAGTANGISAMRGQPAVAMSSATVRAATRLTGVTYTVSVSTGGPGAGTDVSSGTAVGGVDYSEADSAATITVAMDAAYCSRTNNHSATVNVTATMSTATDADQVVPSVARNATSGAVGSTSFSVVCPSASANQGQELVPENPFPTE